jgi:hypothetical protein
MFYCIGENDQKTQSVGKGETIEIAISAWASADNTIEEFERWRPDTFSGVPIEVSIRKEFIITTV